MHKLDFTDITFHPLSLLDWRGKLFENDGQLFRAIPDAYEQFFRNLLTSPLINQLFIRGLVKTELTDMTAEGHPLIVRHEKIPFVSTWTEWPSLMLRDAALMVCDLNIELVSQGYGTQDGHPWNVLFNFTQPCFVDFGSIVPLEEFTERWVGEWISLFRRCWVLPLTLIAMGHPHLARSVSRAIDVDESIDRLFHSRWVHWFPWWYHRLRSLARRNPEIFFTRLRRHLENLHLPMCHTEWSDYYQYTGHPHHDDIENYNVKAQTILSLLSQLKPRTVIDIGCNKGWYSILAARSGAKVVAIDTVEECVNALYQQARSQKLTILPLLMDFTVATPRHGRKVEFPSATERLVCEVSIMLALIHHLVFSVQVNFERIAQLLSAFTTRYAIVEFIPPDDKFVAKWMRPGFEWYTMDNFIKTMRKRFSLVGVFDSDPPRKILLFQKHLEENVNQS
jgi:SAM-dependent methyltransferase